MKESQTTTLTATTQPDVSKLAGAFNFFDGILAVSKSNFYTDSAVYVFSDLNTWGWIVMGLGALELLAAFMLMSGSEFARWFGIFAAGLNAVGQLMFVPAYPFWALSLFAVEITGPSGTPPASTGVPW